MEDSKSWLEAKQQKYLWVIANSESDVGWLE